MDLSHVSSCDLDHIDLFPSFCCVAASLHLVTHIYIYVPFACMCVSLIDLCSVSLCESSQTLFFPSVHKKLRSSRISFLVTNLTTWQSMFHLRETWFFKVYLLIIFSHTLLTFQKNWIEGFMSHLYSSKESGKLTLDGFKSLKICWNVGRLRGSRFQHFSMKFFKKLGVLALIFGRLPSLA